MNKWLFRVITALFSFTTSILSGLIVEASSLDQFEEALEHIDGNSLVLFDVDETLIHPKDRILRVCANGHFSRLANQISMNAPMVPPGANIAFYVFKLILSQMQFDLIDTQVLSVINRLQERNIRTIAFTKMITGSFGDVPSMEDWRIKQLQELNIDFSTAFPDFPIVQLSPSCPWQRSAAFKQGVLCSNNQDKGPVLVDFLKHIEWQPSQVLFLDDRLDYLQTVEDALEGSGIEFFGFHYTFLRDQECVIDEKLAEFQFAYLLETGKWLSDDKALQEMQSRY